MADINEKLFLLFNVFMQLNELVVALMTLIIAFLLLLDQ
jgi:hypothetical protein